MMKKKYFGPYLFIFLSLLPTVFWLSISPLNDRFLNSSVAITSFSQLAALIGTAMFCLTFVLAGRLKWLEDYFGGLPNLYVFHHFFGMISFILLLIHPLLLIFGAMRNPLGNLFLYIIPGSNWAYNYGIFSLFIMTLLLIFTFYRKIPFYGKILYNIWKKTHRFIGLSLFFGALHAFYISSDISRNIFLRYYMFLIIIVGLGSFVYRSLLGRYLVKRAEYRVVEVNKLNKSIVEIVMSPEKEGIDYTQGQFIFIGFDGMEEVHPFSISSSPYEKNLKITVKALGDYTSKLQDLQPGVKAYVEGPFGRLFYHDLKHKNQIWIAGGVGITPFLSMVRSLREEMDKDDYKIDFYYCGKNDEDRIFTDELLGTSQEIKNFRYIPWCTNKHGRITGRIVKNIGRGVHNKEIILCCPSLMNKDLKNQLISLGVPKSRIHFEQFKL